VKISKSENILEKITLETKMKRKIER